MLLPQVHRGNPSTLAYLARTECSEVLGLRQGERSGGAPDVRHGQHHPTVDYAAELDCSSMTSSDGRRKANLCGV